MPEPTLEEFLQPYSADVRALVMETRAFILRAMPGALEIVDAPSKIIAYGTSRSYSGLVCAVAPYKTYINLMFSRGAQLPDPQGLLTGSGKRARHLKVTSPEVLQNPAALALLEAAVKLHGESR